MEISFEDDKNDLKKKKEKSNKKGTFLSVDYLLLLFWFMYKIRNKRHCQLASWEIASDIIPSNYIRKGSLQVFYKIRRNYPEDYILCIGYDRGDTQLAITETFKTYERSVEQVVDRCMNEELSMERIASSGDMLSFVYHEKYATIYCVPLRVTHENVRPSRTPLAEEDEDQINNDDDKKRKLVLFLHGPKEVILNLFSRFSSIEPEISHLVAIPVEKISTVFPKFFPPSPYPMMTKKQAYLHPHHNLPIYSNRVAI